VTQQAVPRQDPGVAPDGSSTDLDLTLVVSMATDVGSVRELNEDCVHYLVPTDDAVRRSKGSLFLVADGMGGHQAGEVASHWAAEQVTYEYYADIGNDPGNSLVRVLKHANQTLYDQSQADPAKSGMGTTMVGAVVLGRRVYVVNVGDSRAYFINKQGISQITEDHSWVEEQVQAGLMTREQAERHPQRNLITRALGSKPAVDVDLFTGEIQEGDILLLCSDGLSGCVSERQIASIAHAELPPQAVVRLIALAKEQKAEDNISVLIVKAAEAQRQQAGRPPLVTANNMGDQVPTEAMPADRASAKHPGAEMGQQPLAVSVVKAWLQDLVHRLPLSAHQRQLAGVVGLAIVVLVCCLCAALVGLPAVSQKLAGNPVAAPQQAPIRDEYLARSDLAWLADYLGYSNPEQVPSSTQSQLDSEDPRGVDLWPAQRGVFVVGLARQYNCQDQTCTFRLEMAGKPYQVSLERQFFVRDDISLSEQQVRVFGYQQEEGSLVTARLIDRGGRMWWAWWQPAWVTVYRNHNWDTAVWVYSVMDRNPYSPVEMDSYPTFQRGDYILLRGKWLSSGPREAMSFATESIYRLESGGYVPVSGEPIPVLPTVTLRPTDNKP
jgi:serine/threonine protein phosphatase PrpC